MGSPVGWNEASYAQSQWNGKLILNIGTGVQNNSNGMVVNIPDTFNQLWLRVLNDRWMTFRIAPYGQNQAPDQSTDQFGNAGIEVYACGYRSITETMPDGSCHNAQQRLHMWCPMPLRAPGKYVIYSDKNSDDWISGIGFSRNHWNHARQSGVGIYWAINGGTATGWAGENWNNDQIAYLAPGNSYYIKVPVVPSGRDKLVYIVQHNDNYNGTAHGDVYVNNQKIGRFRTTYHNAWSTHFNSKSFAKYIAAKVPAGLIGNNDKFITLRVDMMGCDTNLYFREIGTHDYY